MLFWIKRNENYSMLNVLNFELQNVNAYVKWCVRVSVLGVDM